MKRLDELTNEEILELVRADPKGSARFARQVEYASRVLGQMVVLCGELEFSHAVVQAALGEVFANDVARLLLSDEDRGRLLDNWFRIVRERVAYKVEQYRQAEIADAMRMPRH
jgi:hypothetical protein